MATLNSIVQVNITRSTRFPTQKGFGVPLLVTSHALWAARVRRFESITELEDAGADANDPVHKMATAMYAQDPNVEAFVVGKRLLPSTQVIVLTPKTTEEGFVYSFTIRTPTGLEIVISYTVPGAATLASIGTAIAALIDPIADLTAVSVAGVITVTAVAGLLFDFEELPVISAMTFQDTSSDPGIATDLSAIEAASILGGAAVSFFGIAIDHSTETIVKNAATWVDARKYVYAYRTTDSAVTDSLVTTDVASDLKTAAHRQVFGIFAQWGNNDFRDAAWLGSQLPNVPGSNTWAYKTLTGISGDKLLDGEATAAEAKNITTYRAIAGVNVTYEGKTAEGEFVDTIIFQLWLEARLQEAVFANFLNKLKVPYTDAGIEGVASIVRGVLQTGVDNGGLAAKPAPVVTVPKAAEVDLADKAARILRDVQFTGTLAGAIHRVVIDGNISL